MVCVYVCACESVCLVLPWGPFVRMCEGWFHVLLTHQVDLGSKIQTTQQNQSIFVNDDIVNLLLIICYNLLESECVLLSFHDLL